MEKKFVWKAGTQFPVDAQVAVDTIAALQKSLGKDTVTAQELLDDSRAEDSPLHSCFEWDDSIAAEKFRVDQARRLIGSIEIEWIKSDTPEHLSRTRFMVNVVPVAPKVQGQFATVEVAFSNEKYRDAVLHGALRDLRAFQNKYRCYQELSDVFKAIDDFGDSLK